MGMLGHSDNSEGMWEHLKFQKMSTDTLIEKLKHYKTKARCSDDPKYWETVFISDIEKEIENRKSKERAIKCS